MWQVVGEHIKPDVTPNIATELFHVGAVNKCPAKHPRTSERVQIQCEPKAKFELGFVCSSPPSSSVAKSKEIAIIFD